MLIEPPKYWLGSATPNLQFTAADSLGTVSIWYREEAGVERQMRLVRVSPAPPEREFRLGPGVSLTFKGAWQ